MAVPTLLMVFLEFVTAIICCAKFSLPEVANHRKGCPIIWMREIFVPNAARFDGVLHRLAALARAGDQPSSTCPQASSICACLKASALIGFIQPLVNSIINAKVPHH